MLGLFGYRHPPTGEDELAVIGMDAPKAQQEMLNRCLLAGDKKVAQKNLPEILEEIAPIMNTELDANCPECGKRQPLHFDMHEYLLSALLQEQHQLINEIHQLAIAYGWGLKDILELPRRIRKAHIKCLAD